MTTLEVTQNVQLVDGTFTPSEAYDLISAIIDQKINFHKLHRLSISEGNENEDTSFDSHRIAQLQREKDEFKALCREAKMKGSKIRLNSVLDVELT